eukprot:TRINITY_DN65016_c0_g1_i1.p1 TRINITY_DN65016_c0_g1~~TRINITY_DN65016_c0_g1_i1.p1  ORF type:complete len:199 (-),score=0.64 TRINITY_DN65016_c0_g1_i1:59-619(-)
MAEVPPVVRIRCIAISGKLLAEVAVSSASTVGELKQEVKVADQTSLSSSLPDLVFGQNLLEDHEILGTSGICDGTTLQVVYGGIKCALCSLRIPEKDILSCSDCDNKVCDACFREFGWYCEYGCEGTYCGRCSRQGALCPECQIPYCLGKCERQCDCNNDERCDLCAGEERPREQVCQTCRVIRTK